MSASFAIRSRRVLVGTEGEPRPATLVIHDGTIAEILPYEAKTGSLPSEDLGDKVLMAGIVDTHAHINEPGRTDWEGFQTATRAAAAGGITTVIDMPLNSIPATTTLEALKIKTETAQGKCAIDYGFWGGVIPGNSGELARMVDEGALGFKAFLCPSGVDEFPMSDEAVLREAMPILARTQVPLLVHAEVESHPAPPSDAPSRAYADYLASRPPEWEIEAIRQMIRLARETGCRTHIVHLSAAAPLEDLRQARTAGVPITAETCPHYLHFEAERIPDGKTPYKCAPPIRERANRERLWQGIANDIIEFIVSDHSPCTPALKKLEAGDFMHAWGGIAGLQFSMPVVWTGMRKRGLTLRHLTRSMSERTAKFAGLAQKGVLAVGKDADLIVWDPEATFRVQPSEVLHRHRVTPYEGADLHGRVLTTYLRGQKVYHDGQFPTRPMGRQQRRT